MIPTVTGVAVLLGLAVIVSVRGGRGERGGLIVVTGLMRCVLILVLGVVLMGPSGVGLGVTSFKKPVLRVMIDTSASMQTADVGGVARYEFASQRWLTAARLERLREHYEVELLGFDGSVRVIGEEVLRRPASEVATGGESAVARSVSGAVMGVMNKGSAVVVLSDGRDTLGAGMHPVGQLAGTEGVPIYTVALGGASLSRDVAVVAVPGQPYLFVGEGGRIVVRVMQSNAGESRTVLHVEVQEKVESFPIVFDGEDSVAVDVPILHEAAGAYEYRVWVEAIPGEVETTNNAQPVFIDVTGKRLRVLILEGRPYWDTKFLAHALRKDSRVELTQVTQISSEKREVIVSKEGAAAGVPGSWEGLSRFDVIVLGRDIEKVLDVRTAGMLARYVSEHGGRLVFARGRAYDVETAGGRGLAEVLSVIEPVVFGEGVLRNQRIELEAAGMMHPGFNAGAGAGSGGEAVMRGDIEMPSLVNLPVVLREKAGSRVLARTVTGGFGGERGGDSAGQPAIVTMAYGQGMVVSVLGDGLWKWGLRPREKDSSGGSFDRFWMDMVRWLALGSDYRPGEVVSLRLTGRGVAVGDSIGLDLVSRVGFDEVDVKVYVEGPSGERVGVVTEAVAGSTVRRRGALHSTEAGVHRVVVEGVGREGDVLGELIEAKFNCYDVDLERLHTSVNKGALRVMSELSGGRGLDADEPGALFELLDRRREALAVPGKAYYLWDRGWVLGLVLLWAGVEWLARRAGGML